MNLPVADPWYRSQPLSDGVVLITEPHVHPIFSANMFLVTGADADMLVDSGMGIAPLHGFVDALRPEKNKPLYCVSTHTHVDHIGAVHEFEHRLVHEVERADLEDPGQYSLISADIPDRLQTLFIEAGYPPLWEYLVDAVPDAHYDIESYRLKGAAPTGTVKDGDIVDLGDRRFGVLHLPGHSPGQIGLYEEATGILFGGDAIYDGPLIYDGPGMSVDDYTAALKRIAELPVTVVHGGHDPSFGPQRRDEIVAHYLDLWSKG